MKNQRRKQAKDSKYRKSTADTRPENTIPNGRKKIANIVQDHCGNRRNDPDTAFRAGHDRKIPPFDPLKACIPISLPECIAFYREVSIL